MTSVKPQVIRYFYSKPGPQMYLHRSDRAQLNRRLSTVLDSYLFWLDDMLQRRFKEDSQ